MQGKYSFECYDKNGILKWQTTALNLIVNEGLDHFLDSSLGGASQISTWFIGLTDSSPTISPADTSASHSGWTEISSYSESTRPSATFGAVASRQISNASSPAVFTANANTTVGGAFLISQNVKGGLTGVLFSAAPLIGGDRQLISGDTISVSYTASSSVQAPISDATAFVFGHSLFTNTGLPGTSEQTQAGFWINDIASQAGNQSSQKGQFAQLRDQTLPPSQSNQIGWSNNSTDVWPDPPPTIAWDSVNWDFSYVMASNFEAVTVTPSAFVDQSVPVLDFIGANNGGQIIIYAHWAEAAQYGLTIINGNDLSASEFVEWLNLHTPQPSSSTPNATAYHNWHIGYQDEMVARGYDVRMFPVGQIICDLLINEPYLSSVTHADLFMDESPHGEPTVYFLCGLICYRALFEQNPPAGYTPAASSPAILPAVLNNLTSVVNYIESRLLFYNVNGVRVF